MRRHPCNYPCPTLPASLSSIHRAEKPQKSSAVPLAVLSPCVRLIHESSVPSFDVSSTVWCSQPSVLQPAPPINCSSRFFFSHRQRPWMLMRWTGAVCVTLLLLTAHGSERIPFCRCHRFPACAASSFLSSAPRFGGTITKQKLVCQLARLCTTFSEPGAPVVIPKNGTGANSTAFYSIMRTLSRVFRISTACMQTGHSLGRKTTSRT